MRRRAVGVGLIVLLLAGGGLAYALTTAKSGPTTFAQLEAQEQAARAEHTSCTTESRSTAVTFRNAPASICGEWDVGEARLGRLWQSGEATGVVVCSLTNGRIAVEVWEREWPNEVEAACARFIARGWTQVVARSGER